VTVARPDLDASATDVADTVTMGGLGTVAGAVYRPAPVITPQATPLQPDPESFHVTAVFDVPETVAVNCCCVPVTSVTATGDTETLTATMRVTIADPDLLGSDCSVAVTLTVGEDGRAEGAL
jgi:hypothetical protein